MKKHLRLYFFCGIIATNSFAQSSNNPLFRNIPPDATTVVQLNLPVITGRIGWRNLMEAIPDSSLVPGSLSIAVLLRDPGQAGIDLGKDMFIAKEDPTSDSVVFTTVIVHLLDSARFRATLQKEEPDMRVYSIPSRNNDRLAGRGRMWAAWGKDVAILVLVKSPFKEVKDGKGTRRALPNYAPGSTKRCLNAIQGFDGSVYTTDSVFRRGFSDGAAIHIWAEQGKGTYLYEKYLLNIQSPQDLYVQTGTAASKIYTLTAIRLEADGIKVSSRTVQSPELKALDTSLTDRALNLDLQSRILPGNLLGLINLHIDPLKLYGFLSAGNLRQQVDSFMAAKGLSLDTLLQAFSGDFQLVFREVLPPAKAGKPTFPLYFVATVRNPTAFSKVATTVKAISDSAAADTLNGKPPGFFVNFNGFSTFRDNILVVSGSREQSNAWFSNKEKRNTDFLTNRAKESPFSMLIDFKILCHFAESMYKVKQPSDREKKLLELFHAIDHVEVTIGSMKGDQLESFLELKLTDSSPHGIGHFIKMLRRL